MVAMENPLKLRTGDKSNTSEGALGILQDTYFSGARIKNALEMVHLWRDKDQQWRPKESKTGYEG